MNGMLSYVADSDFRLADRLFDWAAPRWFRLWMLWASRLGDGWLWLLAGLALAAGGTEGHRVLAAAAVAAGLANIVLVLVKGRVRRPRPCERPRARPTEVKPLLCFASDCYSFPSGHSLNAFAIGSVISLAFPLLAVPVLLVAASVAASRVVLGLHFLSDVLAGSALGALIGGGVFFAFLA
jgi:undecaprenyl-diphosphatase